MRGRSSTGSTGSRASICASTCPRVRAAAARRRDRRRPDSLDRVSARAGACTRSCRTWRSTSRGPVASVALYTRVEPRDIRSIAMDTSSRTSVALARVLVRRVFGIAPETVSMPPDLEAMLARADAALIIGDIALFLDPRSRHPEPRPSKSNEQLRQAAAIRRSISARCGRRRPACRSSMRSGPGGPTP